jgi:hypothetical protein
MLFKHLKQRLHTWWQNFTMTEQERWLASSADIRELELRLRMIHNHNHYPKLGEFK